MTILEKVMLIASVCFIISAIALKAAAHEIRASIPPHVTPAVYSVEI